MPRVMQSASLEKINLNSLFSNAASGVETFYLSTLLNLFHGDVPFLSFWAAVHVSLVVTSDLDSCFLTVEVSSV